MIRRADGDDFLLVAQHDHALLSGELAEQFGNEYFAKPEPRESVITGVRLHDCGWPLHDDEPTLNKDGLPLDVFETSREIALRVWQASVERAVGKDPYAGLLVSMHVLSLSVFVTTQSSFMQEPWKLEKGREMFSVSKFQQKQIERQEALRAQLGFRSHGAAQEDPAPKSTQKDTDQLNFNFRMLQAMDLISLAACCTKPPTSQTQDVLPQPGAAPLRLQLSRKDKDVIVDPWPFGVSEIELKIPVCRMNAKPFESRQAFLETWKSAPAEVLTSRVIPS